jgi:hypothetical protein
LAAVLCVCVGSQVYAKDYDKPTTGQQSMMRQGSDLINSQIMNDKGNELGRVTDVVYDRNGNPQYLIMSQGGKMYPIPYSSVTVDRSNRRVTLRDFDRNKLEQAPYFSENERNKLGESGFDKKVYGYYGTQYPSTAPQ